MKSFLLKLMIFMFICSGIAALYMVNDFNAAADDYVAAGKHLSSNAFSSSSKTAFKQSFEESKTELENGAAEEYINTHGLEWVMNNLDNPAVPPAVVQYAQQQAQYSGKNQVPGNFSSAASPPAQVHVTLADVQADIAKGLYSKEDYDYMIGLWGESDNYVGGYAVACCVRNRVKKSNLPYKAVITAPQQFVGFKGVMSSNEDHRDFIDAAVAVLRGGPSTIGTATNFRGRSNGYHLWYEQNKIGAGFPIVVNGNMYGVPDSAIHTSKLTMTSDGMIIYNADTKEWYDPPGKSASSLGITSGKKR